MKCALFLLILNIINGQKVSVDFDPTEITKLRGEQEKNITVRFNSTSKLNFTVHFSCQDAVNCEILDPDQEIELLPSVEYENTVNFTIRGLFLGHTVLDVHVSNNSNSNIDLNYKKFKITVLRTATGALLSNIFTGVMVVMVIINTFMMGTQLEVQAIKDCITRPIGPIIGFCCQYILMPLIAFGFANVFLTKYPSLQFGYFAVGCSPGGGMSNFWSILLEGNLDLSVTMTFFSNLAAIGMLPLWLYTLGRLFFKGEISIPFVNVMQSLAVLIIPAFFGLVLTHFKPHLKKRCERILKIFVFFMLLVAIPFAVYANLYVFKLFRWYTVTCGFLLPWSGYVISYLVAWILRQPHRNCRTIAIETGIQNGAIAVILCRFSLPEPDSDMTLVMPICVMCFTGLPLWLWFFALKCCCKRKEKKEQPTEMTEQNLKMIADSEKVDIQPPAYL